MSAKPRKGLSRFLSGPGRGPPARGACQPARRTEISPYANDSVEALVNRRSAVPTAAAPTLGERDRWFSETIF
jgi:hypothetical protein